MLFFFHSFALGEDDWGSGFNDGVGDEDVSDDDDAKDDASGDEDGEDW